MGGQGHVMLAGIGNNRWREEDDEGAGPFL